MLFVLCGKLAWSTVPIKESDCLQSNKINKDLVGQVAIGWVYRGHWHLSTYLCLCMQRQLYCQEFAYMCFKVVSNALMFYFNIGYWKHYL